jgi:hypothetical protein
MLCIMGHPAGVPKRIEAGPSLAPSGNLIRYDDIDTLGGNSGSGVLRASDGRVVGVHTNGGCGPSSPNGTAANFGQRIVALIAASPTLQALTRPTNKRLDDGPVTIKRLDDGPGTIKRLDDGPGTIKVLDDTGTNPIADQIGTRKAVDDVKSPALDKAFGDIKRPGFDGQPPFDPGRPPLASGGISRPFALAHPHHSMSWAGEAQGAGLEGTAVEAYEAALAQLDEVITQHQKVIAAYEAEYRQVLTEYQQELGGYPIDGQGG